MSNLNPAEIGWNIHKASTGLLKKKILVLLARNSSPYFILPWWYHTNPFDIPLVGFPAVYFRDTCMDGNPPPTISLQISQWWSFDILEHLVQQTFQHAIKIKRLITWTCEHVLNAILTLLSAVSQMEWNTSRDLLTSNILRHASWMIL